MYTCNDLLGQYRYMIGILVYVGLLERGEDTTLKEFVEAESRTYKGERFNRFTLEVYHRVKALIQRYVE